MPRPQDKDRLMWLLQEQGTSSNQRVRTALKLADERYQAVKAELIDLGLVEKVRGRGGGVQLTPKGWKYGALPEAESAVSKEADLYPIFVKLLQAEADEDNEPAVVFDTSALRRNGKWVNPDVTKITVQKLPLLRVKKVIVTTYELKQWNRWNIQAVYEAASQRRFTHFSNVVLEWAKGADIHIPEQMQADCSRFGVGLLTMQRFYQSFRYFTELEAEAHSPSDIAVEEFLAYVFERYPEAESKFNELWLKDV